MVTSLLVSEFIFQMKYAALVEALCDSSKFCMIFVPVKDILYLFSFLILGQPRYYYTVTHLLFLIGKIVFFVFELNQSKRNVHRRI